MQIFRVSLLTDLEAVVPSALSIRSMIKHPCFISTIMMTITPTACHSVLLFSPGKSFFMHYLYSTHQ